LGAGNERCFATLTAPMLSCERRVTGEGPPVSRLEQLTGDRAGQWSLRVNGQFRICFRWSGGDAEDVEIVDCH
jgi:plasmid maintenance system killer protein